MTHPGKIILTIIFILSLLLKEEVLNFFFKASNEFETETKICEIQNAEIEEKYKELSTSYGYEDFYTYPLEKSKVLFRNVYDLKDTITIYKGREEGIEEKNLVINEDGLVGIVSKVNSHSSEVLLLKNKEVNLSVKIKEIYGILMFENEELIVKGIDNKQEIKAGDKVYTSDISLYPENIYIGEVKDISMDGYEIEKRVVVTPAVEFDTIRYVSIIKKLRGVE